MLQDKLRYPWSFVREYGYIGAIILLILLTPSSLLHYAPTSYRLILNQYLWIENLYFDKVFEWKPHSFPGHLSDILLMILYYIIPYYSVFKILFALVWFVQILLLQGIGVTIYRNNLLVAYGGLYYTAVFLTFRFDLALGGLCLLIIWRIVNHLAKSNTTSQSFYGYWALFIGLNALLLYISVGLLVFSAILLVLSLLLYSGIYGLYSHHTRLRTHYHYLFKMLLVSYMPFVVILLITHVDWYLAYASPSYFTKEYYSYSLFVFIATLLVAFSMVLFKRYHPSFYGYFTMEVQFYLWLLLSGLGIFFASVEFALIGLLLFSQAYWKFRYPQLSLLAVSLWLLGVVGYHYSLHLAVLGVPSMDIGVRKGDVPKSLVFYANLTNDSISFKALRSYYNYHYHWLDVNNKEDLAPATWFNKGNGNIGYKPNLMEFNEPTIYTDFALLEKRYLQEELDVVIVMLPPKEVKLSMLAFEDRVKRFFALKQSFNFRGHEVRVYERVKYQKD